MMLHELAANVRSKADLANFVRAMVRELTTKGASWENGTLESFLAAFASWTEDMDGYYANRGEAAPEQPSWRHVAEMLLAATMYE